MLNPISLGWLLFYVDIDEYSHISQDKLVISMLLLCKTLPVTNTNVALGHHLGVSENSVPLNPMVLLIIIPMKWL